MEIQKNKVCGADIHKKFIMATILSRNETKSSGRFGMTLDEIVRFKEWVINNNCEAVAIESTGVYWIPIYTVLEGSIEVILANAYKIKHTPGKKTDKRDSKWLAELCLNGMIEPSRIFPKDDRDIRALTRAREKLVNNSTQTLMNGCSCMKHEKLFLFLHNIIYLIWAVKADFILGL
ncbi:MAG: transposase [Candidatus Methanoperedens sp.]|nr:transposase [Candidatus Methanoperedens sp.]